MQRIWNIVDNLSPIFLILLVWILLAPWPMSPEPHLVEKYHMFMSGTLTKPIDIFDVFWHGWPVLLAGLWGYRWIARKRGKV